MIESLISGKDLSQCILIEDSVKVSGRGLLKCFLHALTQRVSTGHPEVPIRVSCAFKGMEGHPGRWIWYDVVHLVLYDVTPATYIRGLPAALIARLKIHDGATDPLGWKDITTSTYPAVTMDTDLSRHLGGGLTKTAVVIDSLDALILHRSTAYTCQTLHRVGRGRGDADDADPVPIVALLHADLHDDAKLGMLRHCATSYVRVAPPLDPTTYQLSAQTVHRRPSGKVMKAHEELTLNSDLTIGEVERVVSLGPIKTAEPAPDPTAGVTFNLSLSEGEREARSKLVLPYTIRPAVEPSVPILNTSAKIFYQPDEADDFDEEDPDDDLDI